MILEEGGVREMRVSGVYGLLEGRGVRSRHAVRLRGERAQWMTAGVQLKWDNVVAGRYGVGGGQMPGVVEPQLMDWAAVERPSSSVAPTK